MCLIYRLVIDFSIEYELVLLVLYIFSAKKNSFKLLKLSETTR